MSKKRQRLSRGAGGQPAADNEGRRSRGVVSRQGDYGCPLPPMAWGVVMLHADEVPHRRRRCQVLALLQSPFSSVSPWPPPAPGTPLGSALYNPGGALHPGIQHPAPRHFSSSHIVGYTLIYKHNNKLQPKKL